MSIYLELLLVAAIVTYIVGLSGFTDTWLGWLSKALKGPVTRLRPFSCAQCMTWWCCLSWCAIRGDFTLATVAASAGFAFFSITIEQILLFIREALLRLIDKCNGLWD